MLIFAPALGGPLPSCLKDNAEARPLKGNQVEDLNCPAAVSSPFAKLNM
jgi:hypothetical protein